MEPNKMFLVKVDELYFTRRTKSSVLPMGSPIPSVGRAFSYEVAFMVAQKLKDFGYISACVCTPDGQPATVADINPPPNLQASAEFRLAWDAD